jgi:hypothetical protein
MARRFWSTRVWPVLGLLAALLGGVALGAAWCSWRAERPWVPLLEQRALLDERQRLLKLLDERQRHLDVLEQRVQQLEQRPAPPPGGPH